MKAKNLEGLSFGRLTVVCYSKDRSKQKCICSCGAEAYVSSCKLLSGHTRSCGCLHREAIGAVNKSHGMSKTPTYKSWLGMRERCNNKSHKKYPLWGGRGIKVCSRWASFENFYIDMGERPKGHTIDRIDNDGDYEPSNCRWATDSEQANNRRNNRMIIIEGSEQTIANAARILGITYEKAYRRFTE